METEAAGRIDELEMGKTKLSAALSEAEETIDGLNAKIAATEKSKGRMEIELVFNASILLLAFDWSCFQL